MMNMKLMMISVTSLLLIAFPSTILVVHAQRLDNLPSHHNLHQETVTKLRFYVQDFVGGEKPTVWKVAQSNLTDLLPSAFGLLSVLDNLVTYGPRTDSGVLGRIQGVIALSDFHEKALVMLLNVVFTQGEFKGSTLAVLGRNPLNEAEREVPIVGGTGEFRLARGYAVQTTYDSDGVHGIVQYDVVVLRMSKDVLSSI